MSKRETGWTETQLEMNQDISSCLTTNYKNDFDADLNFLSPQPIPVTTYSVYIAKEAT